MRLRYTRRAVRQLDAIYSYISSDSPLAAAGQIARVRHSIELLMQFPEMGHIGKSPRTLELVAPGTHFIVVYRLVSNEVQILSVFDGRRRKSPR